MRIKRNAFTLSELLIALAVIGILTAVMMPIISALLPNQNVIMAKRAFYTTETIISDLINDDHCYPKISTSVGFDDGLGYGKCKKYGGEDNPSKKDTNNSSEKFATLFADKLNLKGEMTNSGGKYKFKTRDGIEWELSNFNFVQGDVNSSSIITVDVNPSSNSPNCGESTYSGTCEGTKKKEYDKFSMRILANGKIQILDCWAIKAVMTDQKLIGKNVIVPEDCEGVDGYVPPPEDCSVAPSKKDSPCCSDDKWKNSSVCTGCVTEPTSADDYCCKSESGSSWVGTQVCDACTYTTPTSPEDECCQAGHKWYGSEECNPCTYNSKSLACCQQRATNEILYEGDECCSLDQIVCKEKEYVIELVNLNSVGGLDCSNPSNSQYCASTTAQYAVFPAAIKYCSDKGMELAGTYVMDKASENILTAAQNMGKDYGIMVTSNMYGAGYNCASTMQFHVSSWQLLDGGSQFCIENQPNTNSDNNHFVCYKLK